MYKARKRIRQSLSTVSTRYQLNEESGLVEECGIIDDFALIQSSADTAFDKVLERLGYFDQDNPLELYDPTRIQIVDDQEVSENLEDLGYTSYADFLEKVQDYAEKRKLPAKYTPEQIVQDMREQAGILKERLEKEVQENEVSESIETKSK
nr:MAG TPA: hypothetical protein [Microviridae sp.]